MSDHFAAFSFVDRIADFAPGKHARGYYQVPRQCGEFPPCLVAEAVGQLAAWVAMDKVDYRGRPVAALAAETVFEGDVAPGEQLELEVDVEDCDDAVIAYGGEARVDGKRVIELSHCLGPMLAVEDFDAPEALRERFQLLRGRGATPGAFGGLPRFEVNVDSHIPGQSLAATLQVPERAAFFGDHFLRRPVFPATLLLDVEMRLAMRFADAGGERATAKVSPRRMTNVKMRAFITPGQRVGIEIESLPANDEDGSTRLGLRAKVGERTVATARVELAARVDEEVAR